MRGLSIARRRWAWRAGIHEARQRLAGDGGAAMVMVAASMIVIMGAAALTVDIGNGYRIRRSLIPATDAGALAAAQDFADITNPQNGCTNGTAQSFVVSNEANVDVPVTCTPFTYSGGQQGRVTVTATHNVNTWFAAVIGSGDYSVSSTSTAVWGPPASVTGLRPIGLCIDGSSALQNIVDNPPTTETVIVVNYSKDQPDDCGGSSIPGNWGTVDFDGGANSNADTKDWIENGYPDPVTFGNHGVSSCTGEPHCYEGDTGALSGINSELNGLKSSGIYFTLPVFNFVENPGGNALLHLMGVVRVRLIDYKVNGPEAARFFELSVKPGLITGTCCGGGGGSGGNKVITICGVDPGQFTACDP